MKSRNHNGRWLTAVLACALTTVLLVPAAAATPGNGKGNGNGNGPPAWAGGGNSGGNGGGKPDWAGNPAGKAEKAAQKAERRAAREDTSEDGAPKHDNPAWVCKFERDRVGADAFADEYGENENQANAFGKCVSREAHDRDGVTPEAGEPGEAEEPGDEEISDPGEPPEDETALPASVQALLHYLWPFLF